MNKEHFLSDPSSQNLAIDEIRQLEHDIKNHLSVITMGMLAMRECRDDETRFNEMYDTIVEGGVTPLKQLIKDIVNVSKNERP